MKSRFDPSSTDASLVLVCKRPSLGFAKQRLAAGIGQPGALRIADALLACAMEDLRAWPGATIVAPDAPQHLDWAQRLAPGALCIPQGTGNLGERLQQLDQTLRAAGHQHIIYIGSDCPLLRVLDYRRIASLLRSVDTVLMPARDGGVVLMASAESWPALADLPWSTDRLAAQLASRAREAGRRLIHAGMLFDVDEAADLAPLAERLRDDSRPARRALRQLLLERIPSDA